MNWRFDWDYSGGKVFENMVHQLGCWTKVLELKIPRRVTMTADNYLSPKMQVPDSMSVSMHQPEKIFFTWNSSAQPQRIQLPLRNWIPLRHCVSDGHCFIGPRSRRAVGRKARGYRLRRTQ